MKFYNNRNQPKYDVDFVTSIKIYQANTTINQLLSSGCIHPPISFNDIVKIFHAQTLVTINQMGVSSMEGSTYCF